MIQSADVEFADAAEVSRALASLTAADQIRLKRLAQYRTTGLRDLDWRDLLHDAVDRTLSGRRRWPRGVPFLVFMQQTMRSLAHEHWRRRVEGPEVSGSSRDETVADDTPTPEQQVVARELLAHILNLFSGDAPALAVLAGLADDKSPAIVIAEAGIDQTAYDSARRRIRRTLDRSIREGKIPDVR